MNSAVRNFIVDVTDRVNGEILILSMHFTFVSVSVLKWEGTKGDKRKTHKQAKKKNLFSRSENPYRVNKAGGVCFSGNTAPAI